MSNAELKEILQRIIDNDQSAFDDLYSNYSKVIFGIALSVLKNEDNCYDVIQLVMSKLYTMPKENFPSSHELTWLYTVTKNETLQFMRKERSHVSLDEIAEAASVVDELSQVIEIDTYNDMIKSLDAQSKAIVTLKIVAGFSHKEIGKLLHLPQGTVQWKYHMAVHKLRIALTNLVLFVMFGLGDIAYYLVKQAGPSSSDSRPEGLPRLIDLANTDYVALTLGVFTLLTLILSIVFLIKHYATKRRTRKHTDNR